MIVVIDAPLPEEQAGQIARLSPALQLVRVADRGKPLPRDVMKGEHPDTVVYVGNKEVGRFLRTRVFGPGRTMTWNELTRSDRSLVHLVELALGPGNHPALLSAVDALLAQMDTDAPVARDDVTERAAPSSFESSPLEPPANRPESSGGHSASTEGVDEVRRVGERARRWARGVVARDASTCS